MTEQALIESLQAKCVARIAERDALNAELGDLPQAQAEMLTLCKTLTQERDALAAKLAEMEKQEPYCFHWEDRWGCNHYADPKESIGPNAIPLFTTPGANHDAKRLDFLLDKKVFPVKTSGYDIKDGYFMNVEVNGWQRTCGSGLTPRDAIDACMKAVTIAQGEQK